MSELPIFVKWLETLSWVLQTAEKFPKRVRGTITDRMINLTFDVVEDFTEARYVKHKTTILKRANLRLEKIRILLRIAHEQQILSHQAYKHGIYRINEVGQMLGGWVKQQEEKP
jgi:23S rRNA-intervening sequence protein